MAGDIEEFLRRAAQRRAQQQNQPQQPPARKPAPRPQSRPQPARLHDVEIIEDAEIIDADVLSGGSVAEHVQEHIRGGVFDERLSRLGEDVDASDDRMEEHLHEYFEHDLGQLGAKTARASDSILDDDSPGQQRKPEKPVDYLALLQNPQSIRQAIILNEILARPTDRW